MAQPAVLTSTGVHRCVHCRTDWDPPDVPEVKGHVSVRWGDSGKGYRVLLNGSDVTKDCLEARPGPGSEGGYVVVYVLTAGGQRQACPVEERIDGGIVRHPLAERILGDVQVVRE